MRQIYKTIFILLIYIQSFVSSEVIYIRSTLPNKNGVVYNPDNGRPFNNVAVEFYDNGELVDVFNYSFNPEYGEQANLTIGIANPLYQEYPATQRLPTTQTTQEDINPLALR